MTSGSRFLLFQVPEGTEFRLQSPRLDYLAAARIQSQPSPGPCQFICGLVWEG